MTSIEIFFSYAHEDERLQEELRKQLSLLRRQGLILDWYDRRIIPGRNWENEIDVHLNNAQIILLLVSPDFIASDYCYGKEMKRAIERYETGEAYVVPIILRPTDWQNAPFGMLQALPKDGKPVTRWANNDEAFLDITQSIRSIVEKLNKESSDDTGYIENKKNTEWSDDTENQHTSPNPYRGLSAFQVSDAPLFFGREEFTTRLIESFRQKTFLAVLGASGSGKSSVVFAGLLAHLSKEETWEIITFRPGDRPLRSLSASLISLLETQLSEADRLFEIHKLTELFRSKTITLCDVAERILQKRLISRLLFVVDQFEELYALCRDVEERQHFLDILLSSARILNSSTNIEIKIVITLRADFLGQALSSRLLTEYLQYNDLKIGPMSHQELEDIIKKPSEKMGVNIQSGLTQRILEALDKEPGNLPLLEFTLTLLWTKQQNGQLTHNAYDEIGGVGQSLIVYAEDVYTSLSEAERKQARRIFIQLVRPGEGTEDTRRLATRSEVTEKNWHLVPRLSDTRLLVSGRNDAIEEETVEIAHEALITNWSRLQEWMEQDRSFRLWQERLRASMWQWEASGKDVDALLRGVLLKEAETWLSERESDVSLAEIAFIKISRTPFGTDTEYEKALTTIYAIRKLSQFLSWFFGVLETTLGIRFVLHLFGATSSNIFVDFMNNLTDIILYPFLKAINNTSLGSSRVLEWSTILGAIVYIVLFLFIFMYLHLLISKPSVIEGTAEDEEVEEKIKIVVGPYSFELKEQGIGYGMRYLVFLFQLILILTELLLSIRFLSSLFGLKLSYELTSFIYLYTNMLLSPFQSISKEVLLGSNQMIEGATLFGMTFYALIYVWILAFLRILKKPFTKNLMKLIRIIRNK